MGDSTTWILAAAVCASCVFACLTLVMMNIKLYTEIMKEKCQTVRRESSERTKP